MIGRRLLRFGLGSGSPDGEAMYTTPGTYSFIVPEGITAISFVEVGGGASYGAGAGAGGALAYKNNVAVTPGSTVTVKVGSVYNGTAGSSDSSVTWSGGSLVAGGAFGTGQAGGQGQPGASRDGGGPGGQGGPYYTGGGGGAGGYSGSGGSGGADTGAGSPGTGGGGGGGGGGATTADYLSSQAGGGRGGGVGLFGQGTNGSGGSGGPAGSFAPGGTGGNGSQISTTPIVGAGGSVTSSALPGGVRIIWGAGRAFPSTNCDQSSSIIKQVF